MPANRRTGRALACLSALALLAAACGSSHPVSAHRPTPTLTATPAATPSATRPSAPPSPRAASATPAARATTPAARVATPAAVRTTTPVVRPTTPAPVRTTAAPPAPPPPVTAGLPDFSHVVVIVMENEEYSSIIGNPSAPYINQLANQGALATHSYAITHPSLPNYLALSGGSTFGVTSDCSPSSSCQATGPSIADQLNAAHISWKGYMEDLPACSAAQSDAGSDPTAYAVRHDPFMYYPADVAFCGTNIVPATQLSADIAAGTLPRFAWLTPNLCHDMHDTCGGDAIANGDAYLQSVVPQILGALGPDGAVFITFDEGSSNAGGGLPGAGGGQVTTIVAGSAVKGGMKSAVAYDHYSLLATIEAAWGLPRLGGAASAPTMNDLFT